MSNFRPPFNGDMTLKEAQDLLRTLVDAGETCPCCTQFAKVYRRKINSSMARGLIGAYRRHGMGFGSLQDVRRAQGQTDNREESKLRYWGLMVEESEVRRDDGGRVGWWKVTELGRAWVLGQTTVPKYARLYNGRCLGLTGDPITIRDALGSKFNYNELMAGL